MHSSCTYQSSCRYHCYLPPSEHKKLLEQAKIELKRSQRKDYYKVLGISKQAGDEEIKKAYKKRAMVHHPDRHSNATEEEKLEQEKKFKEVGEAYSVLSDPRKRTRFDQGLDIGDGGGHSYHDIDPTNIFNAFFQGGGGFGGGGAQYYSSGHGHRGSAGGFPF